MSNFEFYRSLPIAEKNGIPIFSEIDGYVENYQTIAKDHVAQIAEDGKNPFIEEEDWRRMEQSTRELVVKHVHEGARILDVGVGLGRLLGPLGQYERHGIDISYDYLVRAKAQGIDVAFSRIEDMPYRDELFDAIVTCDVLEHVLDLDACVRNILRVLKPGGKLIVRVPYREELDSYVDDSMPYEYVHLRNFDVAGLRLLFGKIHRLNYVEHSLVAPVLGSVARLKLRLLPAKNAARDLAKNADKKAGQSSFKEEPFDEKHPLYLLRLVTQVTEEEFLDWAIGLRDSKSEWYDKIVDDLVLPVEMNMVFTKTKRV